MARFSALSAAVVALAFSSQAALVAGQSLDPCVQKSIRDAGCAPTDIKCMCKQSADGSFLTDILSSMVQYCPTTVSVSGLFDQLNSGCKAAGIQIPPKNIADAQQLAGTVFGGAAGAPAGGNGAGAGNGGSSTGTGSNTPSQPSVTPKPTPIMTFGAGLPVSQPTQIGESTAVIGTGAANGNDNSLITAPTATPKPNAGTGTGSTSGSASNVNSSGSGSGSGSSNGPSNGSGSGSGTSSSQSSTTSAKPENAGVRSTASMGAAVIGLAAAVMMW